MRWIEDRLFRDKFLQVGEGEFVYFPSRPLGPGYSLSAKERRKFFSYYFWMLWVGFLALTLPTRPILARVLPNGTGSWISLALEFALPASLFILSVWALQHRAERYLKRVGRARDLDRLDDDNRQLEAQDAARKTEPSILLRLCVLIFVIVFAGSVLKAALSSVV